MSVVWVATSPESGQLSYETRSDMADVLQRFTELRSKGQGYLEVRTQDAAIPRLAFGFRNDLSVIHLFDESERISLLMGDGTVASSEVVEILIMNDVAEFTGEFVLDVDHGWKVVRDFINGEAPSSLGEWCEM